MAPTASFQPLPQSEHLRSWNPINLNESEVREVVQTSRLEKKIRNNPRK